MDDASRLSYSNGPSDQPLIGETIGANLERTVAAVGGREALVDVPSGRRWTYAQLNADVDAVASGLTAAGIAAGDRVGIWAPNCPEWVLVQYATAKIGAILVNINPAYRSHELSFVLRQSGVGVLVSAQRFKTSDYRAMIDEVRGDLPGLRQMVYLGTDDWARLAAGQGPAAGQSLAAGQRAALGRRAASLSFDDPINIQYTSGTTGFPKGATLSHHNILNNGYFIGELCQYTERDRVCIPVPFYHCFGMVMGNLGCTTHGACMVIPAPGFDPAATLHAVQAERCTSLYGVPTMFIAELGAGRLRPLRPVLAAHRDHGGLALPDRGDEARGQRDAHDRGDDLLRDDRDVAGLHPDHRRRRHGPPGVHGGPGAPAPRGQDRRPGDRRAGAARQSRVSCAPAATRSCSATGTSPPRRREVIDAARWMHTGDLATMDEAGYVNIVGRSKDMIIRGGENVYPREVEEFLYGHPAIEDVQVIGVPDARYGEELCAWVRVRRGQELTEADRQGLLRRQDRALQGAEVRPVHRRFPDDRHRQGAEVQDAGGVDRRTRPGDDRHADGVTPLPQPGPRSATRRCPAAARRRASSSR